MFVSLVLKPPCLYYQQCTVTKANFLILKYVLSFTKRNSTSLLNKKKKFTQNSGYLTNQHINQIIIKSFKTSFNFIILPKLIQMTMKQI